jgi:hypothetical protein
LYDTPGGQHAGQLDHGLTSMITAQPLAPAPQMVDRSLNAPPNCPKGVRAALRIKTSLTI